MIDISLLESETTQGAIERLKHEAAKKVLDGAELLVLSDRTAYEGERRSSTRTSRSRRSTGAAQFQVEPGEKNLRRRTAIVLRSGAIRNVHDVCMALGLGADGVCPYVMVEVICVDDYEHRHLQPLLGAAQGHREGDLDDRHPRGARLRAAVLLDRAEARARRDLRDARPTTAPRGRAPASPSSTTTPTSGPRILAGEEEAKPAKTFRFYPKVYKAAIAAANGTATFEEYSEKVRELEQQSTDLDAPHPRPAVGDREPIDPARSTPASATTPTRS